MEFKQEHLLFFAFAVLAVIVLWDIKNKTAPANLNADQNIEAPQPDYTDQGINLPTPDNIAEAANYLTAAQPYYFAYPPYQSLPETTSGQIGETANIVLN